MSWLVQEKNIGGNVKLTLNMSGKYLRIQLLTPIESWIIALTAQVERKGTLPSFRTFHMFHTFHTSIPTQTQITNHSPQKRL